MYRYNVNGSVSMSMHNAAAVRALEYNRDNKLEENNSLQSDWDNWEAIYQQTWHFNFYMVAEHRPWQQSR